MSHRSSALNGRGSRRSPGGRPEPIWPPAFALRGPDENFPLAPGLRRDRFTRAAGDGLRAACRGSVCSTPGPLRRLNPVRPKPTTGGGCQVPPGSTVCHPADSPASAPVRASTDPGRRRIRVLGRAQRCSFPLDRAPSHVRLLGPGRLPLATGREKCTPGSEGACDKGSKKFRPLKSLGDSGRPLMGMGPFRRREGSERLHLSVRPV